MSLSCIVGNVATKFWKKRSGIKKKENISDSAVSIPTY